MAFLRPAVLFEGVGIGDFIQLSVLELEVSGRAWVLSINECPPIEPGPGRVVVGTFSSQSVDVRRLRLAGLNGPLDVTGNHPVFSEDRLDFVPLNQLHSGERLRTRHGVAVVESSGPLHGRWKVHNLEVEGAHQYYVTDQLVLVHNANGVLAREAADDLLAQQGVTEQSLSEAKLAQEHHLVTRYLGAGEDAAASREILADAGVDLEDDANITDVPGHYGPHPPAYHAEVLRQLQEAIGGLEPGSDSFNGAVRSALLDLKNIVADPNNWLTGLITR
jgi:hypothetical protein